MKEMKNIAIFGAGGFGREVACLLKKINEVEPTWNFLGFYDDGLEKGTAIDYGTILGGRAELNAVNEPLCLVIALGDPKTLKSVVESVTNENITFPNIVSPDLKMLDADSVKMGKGNVVAMGNFISCNVTLGNFNMLVGFSTIGHDSTFGNYNCLMPASRFSGKVTIGNENLFGTSAVVMQGLTIGEQNTIAPGSIVMANTKDGHTYLGNPAKKVF